MHGSLSCIILVLLTLCRRHTDVLSEERTSNGTGLDPPRNGLGYLLDAQVDQLTQRKRNNHCQGLGYGTAA